LRSTKHGGKSDRVGLSRPTIHFFSCLFVIFVANNPPMTSDAKLLSALRRAQDEFTTILDLAEIVGEPSDHVASRLSELRRLGFTIEERPHVGCRLIASPDALVADDLQSRLNAKIIGAEILVFQETESTNAIAERMALNGAREGLVIFAESQTKGRGRMGRKWISPKGKGLWFSVMLRPQFPPTAVTRLTILTAVAVAQAIRETTGLDARIKWPNDILVNGKKVAGILTEMLSEAHTIRHAIIGIGVDVRCAPQDFPPEVRAIATSLEHEANTTLSRPELAARILSLMDLYYATAHGHFEEIVDEWAGLCSSLGKRVNVAIGTRRIEGTAQALDGDGALLVRCDNGNVEKIVGGDLVLERAQL
jgi:BirA family biotin operon repressor/biotin-[acetyl-CoA-carboxylase] ligase